MQAKVESIPSSDSFTLSADGHYIGHDGFVVPKDFTEFYERYPDYVRNWVWSKTRESDDLVQNFLLHLMTLPNPSKYRDMGYTDRIQTFDPVRSYGASQGRFFWYVHVLLLNHYNKTVKRTNIDPLSVGSNVPFGSHDRENRLVDESYVAAYNPSFAYHPHIDEHIGVDEFISFVQEYNPELVPMMDTLVASKSFAEARRNLNMRDNEFERGRSRLARLRTLYDSGITSLVTRSCVY